VTHHAMRRFRATKKPIARYLFLRDLQLFNPRVYFHMLMTRTEELLPFIYTPTVGEACQTYHELPMLTQVRSGTQLLSHMCALAGQCCNMSYCRSLWCTLKL
jgi:malic enzyme